MNEFALKRSARGSEVDAKFRETCVQSIWERISRRSKGITYNLNGVMHVDANILPKASDYFILLVKLQFIIWVLKWPPSTHVQDFVISSKYRVKDIGVGKLVEVLTITSTYNQKITNFESPWCENLLWYDWNSNFWYVLQYFFVCIVNNTVHALIGGAALWSCRSRKPKNF